MSNIVEVTRDYIPGEAGYSNEYLAVFEDGTVKELYYDSEGYFYIEGNTLHRVDKSLIKEK